MKPLRVGLIGCGGISGSHLEAYQRFPEQVALTGCCDPIQSAAERRAQALNVALLSTDYTKFIKEAPIDAVDICTPHSEHAPVALAAAAAGKHILIEKPFACTEQECRDVIAAAEKAGVTLMIGQCQRYDRSYRTVKRLMDSGELGTIRGIRFDSMQNLSRILQLDHWLFDEARAGGGIVISVSVHRLDLARYFVGDIVRVGAFCKRAHPSMTPNAEDYAAFILEFANGAIGESFATYNGYRMPWSEMFMIFGDKGAIHAVPPQGKAGGPALICNENYGTRPHGPFTWSHQFEGFVPVVADPAEALTDHMIVNEILHWADCCASGAEPISSGRDNLKTMQVIFAIYESARTGQMVAVRNG